MLAALFIMANLEENLLFALSHSPISHAIEKSSQDSTLVVEL